MASHVQSDKRARGMNVTRGQRVWLLLVVAAAGLAAAPATTILDAAKKADTKAVRTLIQASADVNTASPDGTTALHWAVNHADPELVDLLIRAGAKVDAVNRYGM